MQEKPHSFKRSVDKIRSYYQSHPDVASFSIDDSGFVKDSNKYEFTLNIELDDSIPAFKYYPEVDNRMGYFQSLIEHCAGLDGDLISMIDVEKAAELDDPQGHILLLDFILPCTDGLINEQRITHV